MSWARRRQASYLGIAGGIVALAVIGLSLAIFLQQPTCFDGRQNGDERGVDCGGACTTLCLADVRAPVVLWSRALPVAPSLYHLVAYVDNLNPTGAAIAIPYSFKVFDDENLLIAERRGTAFLLPGSVNPIFEPGLSTGKRIPARTFFEFTSDGEWRTASFGSSPLVVEETSLTEDPTPRLEATLRNQRQDDIDGVEIVAVLFDAEGNALTASRSLIPSIGKTSSVPIVFTWPERLPEPVARVEVTPRARPAD